MVKKSSPMYKTPYKNPHNHDEYPVYMYVKYIVVSYDIAPNVKTVIKCKNAVDAHISASRILKEQFKISMNIMDSSELEEEVTRW